MPGLRERLGRERLFGTFLKTPAPHQVELAALSGCDFVSPDMEHAPLDLGDFDRMAGFAGRSGIPLLPRLPSHDPAIVGRLLDAGAAGILAPHVGSDAEAERLVAAARFERGQRGFSPSPRAGDYGALGAEGFLKSQTTQTVVALQIEDRAGLEAVDKIAAVPGVDALFVGPADLSVSLGVSPDGPEMNEAMERILTAGQDAGLACGIFTATGQAAAQFAARGFDWFIIGSDQSHLRTELSRQMAAASTS